MTGRKKMAIEDKVKKICIALKPNQLSKIREFQIKYMQKHDTTLSFSKVMSIVIKNGIKATRQKDMKK